jgi:thiamine biosynthesis protein ThiS
VLVFVNSKETQIPEGTSVQKLLEILAFAQKRVAVEVNTQLVTKGEWPSVLLKAGDRIEIVSFVGGG